MPRISERISAALTNTLTCPSCKQAVTPQDPAPAPAAEGTGGPGRARFSYIWTEPGGKVCPECGFPLDRFTNRLKWLRMFMLGILLLAAWFVTSLTAVALDRPGWLRWIEAVLAGSGLVLFVVGILGLIVGRRRPAT